MIDQLNSGYPPDSPVPKSPLLPQLNTYEHTEEKWTSLGFELESRQAEQQPPGWDSDAVNRLFFSLKFRI